MLVREGLPFALAEMLRTVQPKQVSAAGVCVCVPEQVSAMQVSRRCLQQTYFTELQ